MNLRPASLPPASSKPTSPPYCPLRYRSARSRWTPCCCDGMDDPLDLLARAQEIDHRLRILAVLVHAQCQRLQALDDQERVERRQRRADVAQQRHPRLDRVGDRTDRLDRFRPDRAVVARIGRVERRLPVRMRGPIEIAAVDDQPADRIAVAAEIFGRRIDDDGGAVLERPQEERRGGVVDDQRDAERPADRGDFRDREDGQLRVWQQFRRSRRACGRRWRAGNSAGRSDRRSAPRFPGP